MKIYRLLPLFFLLTGCLTKVFATHNRAGEITYVQVDPVNDPLLIKATITTYTKESSRPADRDSLEICWGDGTCEFVQRSNGNGDLLPNDTKRNFYMATHRYPANGRFLISMTDPNRNGGILNVNPPTSDNVPFHLETTVSLLNTAFTGPNNSPVLLQPPIDIGCVGQPFTHNPSAYDPDGDSLVYELIVPLQDRRTQVPNYSFPDQIGGGAVNRITLDRTTGDLLWFTPQRAGEYNVAMYIIQYRNGLVLDTMIRDMQILVIDCDNLPPQIETIDEICVIAGEYVEFEVVATAPLSDSDQMVDLEARGGPLELDVSPANFMVPSGFQPQPLTGIFSWQTTCEHISDQFYTVVFRASDNFPALVSLGDTLSPSTLKSVRIKVVGPPPEDVQVEEDVNSIDISWEKPYACEDADDDYFRGFSVWRREGSNRFPLDTCDPGLEGKGYTRLNLQLVNDEENGRYVYVDNTVRRGRTYCYRILGEFARATTIGVLYNRVESLASEEMCVQLSKEVPLITNVSVETTDDNNGDMFIQWSKPDPIDLDTVLNPGPYRYELLRAEGLSSTGFVPVPGASFTSTTFAAANDTFFTDTGLNTAGIPYTYQLNFYVNGNEEPFGTTSDAGSIFLEVASTDNINDLSWEELIPWDNTRYVIYRENAPGVFDSIGMSLVPVYRDSGLINGREYCYKVQTFGTYAIDGVLDPLVNWSQENCGTPLDTIPPCPPVLTVTNVCDELNGSCSPDVIKNNLSWTNPIQTCIATDDVVGYKVYFASMQGEDLQLVQTISDVDSLQTVHFPDFGFAGCYAVTAIDTFNNESAFSNIECVDNCPTYELPNAFTPNNDGQNELFRPINQCFINRVDFQVFNRWGQLVFQTTNPELEWDGTNMSGQDVSEGVYYYSCRFFEQRIDGVIQNPTILKGYIEVLRGKSR